MNASRTLIALTLLPVLGAGCSSLSPSRHHDAMPSPSLRGYDFSYQVLNMNTGDRVQAQVFDDGASTFFVLPKDKWALNAYSPANTKVTMERHGPYHVARGTDGTWFVPVDGGSTVLCVKKGVVSLAECKEIASPSTLKTQPTLAAQGSHQTGGLSIRSSEGKYPVMQDQTLAQYRAQAYPAVYQSGEEAPQKVSLPSSLSSSDAASLAKTRREADIERIKAQMVMLQQRLAELSKKLEMLDEI